MSADPFDTQVVDDAIVLYDNRTETTRWVVWKHRDNGKVSLAIVQKGQVVSVNIENLLYLCAKVLPKILPIQN